MDGLSATVGGSLFSPEAAASVGVALCKSAAGGTLFILLAALLIRGLPRLPANARFMIWWLACLKMVVGLIAPLYAIAFTVNIPHRSLPTPPPALRVLRKWATASPSHSLPQRLSSHGKVAAIRETGHEAPDIAPPIETESNLPWHPPTPAEIALVIWVLGVIACAFSQVHASTPIRRIQAEASPLDLSEILVPLCQKMGVRRMPAVAVSLDISSPLVCGLWRPVILLPAALLTRLTAAELRMTLAHELAHIRRGDLWLDLVPALARTLFFFLPLVHFASRECVLCREEVCDSQALRATGIAPGGYGALLLKTVVAQQRTFPAAAAGIGAGHFGQVKRRILALSLSVSPAQRRAGVMAMAFFAVGVIPWRLSAVAEGAVNLATGKRFAALPRYTIVDLGTLGGTVSDAFSVDDTGRVVGTANVNPQGSRGHAFLWNDGVRTDLSEGSVYRHSIAAAVNGNGTVAAWAYNRENRPYAFLWEEGKRRYLGSLPGFRYSRAISVNDAGQVAGVAHSAGRIFGALHSRAFIWQNGRMRDIGTLGGPYSAAYAINDEGLVVGKADMPSTSGEPGETHAFLYDGSRMTDLGTLPGGHNSIAYAASRQGQVVGVSETGAGTRHAFIWDSGRMQDLGLPAGANTGIAYSVNEVRQAVGMAKFGSDESANRAVLWQFTSSGEARSLDLNALLPSDNGWTLETARSINRHGQIVGQGRINGKRHAYLLTPES